MVYFVNMFKCCVSLY